MKRTSARTLGAVSILLLAAMSGVATATPYFRIDTELDWLDALGSGQISPVAAGEFEAMVLGDPQWPTEYQEATFCTPQLYVIEEEYQGEPGLVMAWGPQGPPPTEPTRMAAAWDYTYPLDPDLTDTTIEFSIFPPVPSTMFSLNLIDGNGNYREWIWHAGNPGEVPPGLWSTLIIDPVTGATKDKRWNG